ncbi:MAG TPA: hypothetical protein VEJ18_01175 [Planctomycetota bacterium]|nr:hypothetical protein [Planctomycetota bacterium]
MRHAALLAAALAGCAAPASTSTPPAPASASRAWAVVPVSGTPDGAAFADQLAAALVRRGVGRVVRPGPLASPTAAEAVAAARRLRADAVLAVAVLQHDPYDPPRTVVRVEVLRSDASNRAAGDLEELVSSPSWRGAPLAIAGAERHAGLAYDEVFDARDPDRRAALRAYAAAQESDNGFIAEREFLAVQARWLEFVAAGIVERVTAAP